MIDTVVLRFHDVKFQRPLIQILNQLSKSSTYAIDILSKGYDLRDGRTPKLQSPTNLQAFISKKKENEEAEVFLRFSNKKIVANSFNYNINFHVNSQRDFVEMNFSLPKLLYGTNVFMAVEHWDSIKNVSYSDKIKLEYYAQHVREKLIETIFNFFIKKLGLFDIHLDWSKIEINRIDFCFNQVFKTKQDALTYLKYQKQTRKLYSRESSDAYRNYETSLFYKTKKYSFKVYHKGSEFLKHDAKELNKLNNQKGREVFNIPLIQNLADKTLRYEMTIRNSELSRIFKTKIFRNKCPKQLKLNKIHELVEKYKANNDRIAERINKYDRADKLVVKAELRKKYIKIPKDAMEVYTYVEECINRNTAFMLKISQEDDIYNIKFDEEIPVKALFSNRLCVEAFLKFRSFIREFQLTEKPDRLNVIKLIDDYNRTNKNNLNKSSMIKFFDLWSKYSEKELIEKELFSKATVYRFLSKFKKLGITNKSIIPTFNFDADMDLKPYHNEVYSVRNFIKFK